MADESVKSSEDVLTILRADAADFINVKMTKVGNIEESLKLVNLTIYLTEGDAGVYVFQPFAYLCCILRVQRRRL